MLSSVATGTPTSTDAEDIATMMKALGGNVESITVKTRNGALSRSITVKAQKERPG